jgi:ABC-2 type transport system ATP-binding protein
LNSYNIATEAVASDPAIVSCDSMIQTWDLSKCYGGFDALADCSVRVARGEIFGLLGPNGAGKTTLIRLLLGLLQPTRGRCEIDGYSPWSDGVRLRERVSYLPGDARLPRHMRGGGVIRFFADLHPLGDQERSFEIADQLELDTARHVAFMSTGMRQKLALAVVLGPLTPLLILDEPTANLDPTIRANVLKLVCEARDQGRTVVLSSHVMSEIEETCDRVAFLRRGRLAHELVMSDLFQRHRISALAPREPIQVPADLAEILTIRAKPSRSEGQNRLEIDTAGDLAPLLRWLDSLKLERMRIEPLGLRAVYDSVHDFEEPST